MIAERRGHWLMGGRENQDSADQQDDIVTEDGEVIPQDEPGSGHIIFEEPPIG
jgi:hypothetical protein